MALFVNSLAYHESKEFFYADKVGILLASLASGVVGYLYLFFYDKVFKPKSVKQGAQDISAQSPKSE